MNPTDSSASPSRDEYHIAAHAVLELAKGSVELNSGDDLSELLPQLETKLHPFLTSNRKRDWEFVLDVAEFLLEIEVSDGVECRIRMLDNIAYAHVAFGRSAAGIRYSRKALQLACDADAKTLERKCLSQLATLHNDIGAAAKGAEFAIQAYTLATGIGHKIGRVASLGTLTSSLKAMGLYKECCVLAKSVIEQCDEEILRPVLVQAHINLAMSAFALRSYDIGAQAADSGIKRLGAPASPADVLNAMAALSAGSRNYAYLKDIPQARAHLSTMKALLTRMDLPRVRLNVSICEAICDLAEGNHLLAATQLLGILPTSRKVPALYIDTLQSLIAVYKADGDGENMTRYTAHLTNYLAFEQSRKIATQLESVGITLETLQPGKADASDLADAAVAQSLHVSRGNRRFSESEAETIQHSLERLAVTAELGEDYENLRGRHAYRVGRLSELLARELDFGDRYATDIGNAARLHDIGKLSVHDGILNKPGKLTDDEMKVIRQHTIIGDKLLAVFHSEDHLSRQIALYHHERWDGTGYPKGIAGTSIPYAARIASVVDVFDALTHRRIYKDPWPFDDAISYIVAAKGTQFDPFIVERFESMIRRLYMDHGSDLDAYLVPNPPSDFVRSHDDIRMLIDGLPNPWRKSSSKLPH